MKKLQSKVFLWLYVYLAVLTALRSTYVLEVIPISMTLSRIFTVAVYVPFVLAVGYKLFLDVWNRQIAFKKVSNWIFYVFALYYVALCVYRLTNAMEVKENLYYSIVLFGSIAIYMLLKEGKIAVSKQELQKNLLWIAGFFVAFRLAYVLIGAHFFAKPPININLTSGIVALLVPFLCHMLMAAGSNKKESLWIWIVLAGCLVVIATTGARALFLLTVANVAVMLAVALIRRTGVLRMVTVIAVSVALVVTMVLCNVGQVRYSVYRQMGIDFDDLQVTFEQKATTQSKTAKQQAVTLVQLSNKQPTKIPIGESPEQDQAAAQKQINASNKMRKKLVQLGVNEVKKNPLFGTGDVMYWYQVNKTYGFMQSSHNFLLEAVICYGLIGSAMIAALFISLLAEAKLFTKRALQRWNYTVVLALTAVFHFAFGFVQPTVFDIFICPLFVLTAAACLDGLQEAQ